LTAHVLLVVVPMMFWSRPLLVECTIQALPFLTIDFNKKEEIYQLMRGDEPLIGLDYIGMYPPKIHAIFETPQKTLCLVYSKVLYRLCEISLKDHTVINDGQLISDLPDFYVCQPNPTVNT